MLRDKTRLKTTLTDFLLICVNTNGAAISDIREKY